jgi:hypothetical protein
MFGNMPEVEDNFMINATQGMRSSNYKNKSSFAIALIGLDAQQK